MAKYKKQKDGRYKTSVFTGEYTDEGRPIKKWLSAKTIAELENKVSETRHQINVNAFIFDSSTTYGEFSEQWLKVAKKGKSVATKAMYENVLKLTSDIDHIPLTQISRMALQNIINNNQEHPRTCEQIKLTLKQVFKYAVSEKMMTNNPAEDLELPRHVKKEKRSLTDEEINMIRNAVLPLADRVFISTLYGSGMRPAEMYALTKADIDYDNHCINVNKSVAFDGNTPMITYPKTNAGIRSVIVSNSLLKLLKTYSDTIPYDNLFGDEKGQIMSKSAYRCKFDVIMRKIFNCKGKYRNSDISITPYTFRHHFCTLMYYNGVSLKEAQRQMGHASYNLVLSVYSHLDSKKENTSQKMEGIAL